jgi:hypothetical protein
VFALGLFAIYAQSLWMGVLTFLVYLNCSRGWKQAQALRGMELAPRHEEFACPHCQAVPPVGEYWVCKRCTAKFDTFVTGAVCPSCQAQYPATQCTQCHQTSTFGAWRRADPVVQLP